MLKKLVLLLLLSAPAFAANVTITGTSTGTGATTSGFITFASNTCQGQVAGLNIAGVKFSRQTVAITGGAFSITVPSAGGWCYQVGVYDSSTHAARFLTGYGAYAPTASGSLDSAPTTTTAPDARVPAADSAVGGSAVAPSPTPTPTPSPSPTPTPTPTPAPTPTGSGLTFRGPFTASTAYAVNDILSNAGSSYIVTTAFTSGSAFPSLPSTNLSLFAAKGDVGAPGVFTAPTGSSGQVLAYTSDGSSIAPKTLTIESLPTAHPEWNGYYDCRLSNTGTDAYGPPPAPGYVRTTCQNGLPVTETSDGVFHAFGGVIPGANQVVTGSGGSAQATPMVVDPQGITTLPCYSAAPGAFSVTTGGPCEKNQSDFFGPGYNFGSPQIGAGYGWTADTGKSINVKSHRRGITQGQSITVSGAKIGDVAGQYIYASSKGGYKVASDEGLVGQRVTVSEENGVFVGTVSGLAPNTLYITPAGDVQGLVDGGTLLDMTAPIAIGNITAETLFSGGSPGTLTTDNALTPATYQGTAAAISSTPNGVVGTSVTVPVTATSGTISASSILIFACNDFLETVQPTTVSALAGGVQNVTAMFRYSHNAGCPVYQGGMHGYLDLTADRRAAPGGALLRTSYFAQAVSANTLIYRVYLANANVGQASHLYDAVHAWGTNGGYSLWPGAEVAQVGIGRYGTVWGFNGTATLAPNDVAWAVGHALENPHDPSVGVLGSAVSMQLLSPPPAPIEGFEFGLSGYGAYGGFITGFRSANFEPPSRYINHGGTLPAPGQAFEAQGVWQKMFSGPAPEQEGAVIDVGKTLNNCNSSVFDRYSLIRAATVGETFEQYMDCNAKYVSLGFNATNYHLTITPTGILASNPTSPGGSAICTADGVNCPGSGVSAASGVFTGNLSAGGSTQLYAGDATGHSVTINGGNYIEQYTNLTSAGVNAKLTRFICRIDLNGGCQFQTLNDANGGEATIFSWARNTVDGSPSQVTFATGIQIASTVTPTCNAANRFAFNTVTGAVGAKDVVQVCAKDAADVYAWRTIY